MTISTLTDKGQTTVPRQIRQALKIKPRQKLSWTVAADGSATVRAQASPLRLFGSLKPSVKFSSIKAETEAAEKEAARRFREHTAKRNG